MTYREYHCSQPCDTNENDPSADWDRPALTTHGRNNHALRSPQFRYIRYADGGEELYDHRSDPMEFTNLAGNPEFLAVKEDLARWFPKENVPEAPRDPNLKKKGKKGNNTKSK